MICRSLVKALLVASAVYASMSYPASAGPAAGLARPLRAAPSTAFISASRFTLAPFAFVRFCRDNAQDCTATGGGAPVEMDASRRAELFRINTAVNRAIRPVNDRNEGDVWRADVTSGDCEDYALTKRRHLIAAGWPAGSLRIAVARTSSGEGHAVLVVKTSQGDLVLDNRYGSIRVWNRTDLTWLKIQSPDNPRIWLEI